MNKVLVFAVGVALVFGALLGYAVHQNSVLSTVINPSNALNQQRLINDFNSITQDLQNIRAPLAGAVSYSSSTYTIPAQVGTSNVATSTISSSTPGASALAGILPGDFVLVTISSSSVATKGLVVSGYVSASDTVLLSWGASTSTFPSGNIGLGLRVLPSASFAAPVALKTSTST